MIHLSDIQFAFNRAVEYTVDFKKWFFTFVILALCGLLVVFFRGVALYASGWFVMSLTFFPIFLCAGILLSTGILLVRVYHNEIKKREFSYRELLMNSWELLIGASYIAIPIIFCYLILWVLLGVFILLGQIPAAGEFFSVVLSFAPFLLNLGALLLCVISFALLFYVSPIIALKGLDRVKVVQSLVKKFVEDPFSNLIFGVVGILPAFIVSSLLVGAALLTGTVCPECHSALGLVLQWFFTMIPFTALLSPAVVFFFNFAAEAHVFMVKEKSGATEESE